MLESASRQDIENLRADLRSHVENDRADFGFIRAEIQSMKEVQAGWSGGITTIKWLLGISLPAIFAALLALALKHP